MCAEDDAGDRVTEPDTGGRLRGEGTGRPAAAR